MENSICLHLVYGFLPGSCSLVKTRPFSVVTELWSGEASQITNNVQSGVTNGCSSNASGSIWIDLKPIKR